MEIEKQILDAPVSVSVDRADVRSWVESERQRIGRNSRLVFSGVVLVVALMFGGLFMMFQSEAQQVRQLVGKPTNRSVLMLEEITYELIGQPPAQYCVDQLTANTSLRPLSSL